MSKNPPCEECIVMAICKAKQLKNMTTGGVYHERVLDVARLRNQCYKFYHWYFTHTNVECRNKLADLFNAIYFLE